MKQVNQRRKGYRPLLALTVFLTLFGSIFLGFSLLPNSFVQSMDSGIAPMAAIMPFFFAGVVCNVRKRFFTIES